MIVNDLPEERLANILTQYVYRTPEVEAFHRKKAVMDEALYAKVFRVVSSNLRKIARNHGRLVSTELKDLPSVVEEMSPARRTEFLRYMQAIAFYCLIQPQTEERAPALLVAEQPKENAAFLLGGAFRDGCDRGLPLDDEAMDRIEKDILDRMYTLLRLGLLPQVK